MAGCPNLNFSWLILDCSFLPHTCFPSLDLNVWNSYKLIIILIISAPRVRKRVQDPDKR